MDAKLTQAQSLEERLKNKLREQIGELMTPEDLRQLVARGMNDVLFKPRREREPGQYGREIEKAPLMVEVLRATLEPQMKLALEQWLTEHTEEVTAALQEFLTLSAGDAVVKAISAKFQNELWQFQHAVTTKLGLPA